MKLAKCQACRGTGNTTVRYGQKIIPMTCVLCHGAGERPPVPPVRIIQRRKAGFNAQEFSRQVNGLPAVNVDRRTRWGNPYEICSTRTAAQAVQQFRDTLSEWDAGKLEEYLAPLRGRNLACWCKPGDPCHADVLLELANKPELEPYI